MAAGVRLPGLHEDDATDAGRVAPKPILVHVK
jgi:hypothetical protein